MKLKDIKKDLNRRLTVLLLAAVIVLFTVVNAAGYGFGYNLYINGGCVGSFASEEEAKEVISAISEQDGIDVGKNAEVVFSIIEDGGFTALEAACDNFRKNDSRYCKGYVFTLSGKEVFKVETRETAQEIENELLESYREEGTFSVSFTEPSEIKEEYVLKDELSSREEARELLSGIASVEAVIKLSYYEAIHYGTSEIGDPESYEGVEEVVSEGVTGEKYVEHTTVKVNGETVSSYVSGEFVTAEMKDRIVKKGTKPCPKGVATGSFMNPAEGYISSPFGPRWGRMHKGIDVAAPSGTPLYAADGGEVIYAGWMNGYGYLVQVDHKNGYITYYAHCSRLHVKVGDCVAKGDLIADMGSTGNSTGPHLHFEVRYNNEPQDPQNYVNY